MCTYKVLIFQYKINNKEIKMLDAIQTELNQGVKKIAESSLLNFRTLNS